MNTSELRSVIALVLETYLPKATFDEKWISALDEALVTGVSNLIGKAASPKASPTVAKKAAAKVAPVKKAEPAKKTAVKVTSTKKAESAKNEKVSPTKKAEPAKKEKAEVESLDDIATIVTKWSKSSKKTIGGDDILFFDIGTNRVSIYKGKSKEDEFEEGKFYYLKIEGLDTIHGLRVAKEDKDKLDVFRPEVEEEKAEEEEEGEEKADEEEEEEEVELAEAEEEEAEEEAGEEEE
jgi:hypothetical protein